MIQMQTVLDVADNSGAKKLFCIKELVGFLKSRFFYLKMQTYIFDVSLILQITSLTP